METKSIQTKRKFVRKYILAIVTMMGIIVLGISLYGNFVFGRAAGVMTEGVLICLSLKSGAEDLGCDLGLQNINGVFALDLSGLKSLGGYTVGESVLVTGVMEEDMVNNERWNGYNIESVIRVQSIRLESE